MTQLLERLRVVAAADPELTSVQLAARFGLAPHVVRRYVGGALTRVPERVKLPLRELIAKVKGGAQ